MKAKSNIWPALEQTGEKHLFNMLLKFTQLLQRRPRARTYITTLMREICVSFGTA